MTIIEQLTERWPRLKRSTLLRAYECKLRVTMRRISISISDALGAELAEACEKSGRSLTAEVEARLRHSLDMPGSDRLLLLRFDEGLWAWVNAYERGISLWGNLHDTVIAMVRAQIMDGHDEERMGGHWQRRLARLKPFLPPKMQRAFQ